MEIPEALSERIGRVNEVGLDGLMCISELSFRRKMELSG